MRFRTISYVLPVFSLLFLGSTCGRTAGFIEEGDERVIGTRGAGYPTYVRLINGVLDDMLADERVLSRASAASGPWKVAFVGVENKMREEIREARDAIYEIIDTRLVNEARYNPISKRFVDAAIRKHNLRYDDLFLKDGQRLFTTELTSEGQTPDFLLFATLTNITTQAEGRTDVDYQLTIEMVDANTGSTVIKRTRGLPKYYED